ncbi:collagen-binding domain-containing protein [Levilactobacillus yonginensis]|uniref:collagen-binding domain-containing protein n=1 Tax=Levilactobacillus yonginensis TaxID=1054041 RepID=UPI00345DA29E
MEMKRTHFKMYKAGRKWVFACATILALGAGTAVTAQAATQPAAADGITKVAGESEGAPAGDKDQPAQDQSKAGSELEDGQQKNDSGKGTDQKSDSNSDQDKVNGSKQDGSQVTNNQMKKSRAGLLKSAPVAKAPTNPSTTTTAPATNSTSTQTAAAKAAAAAKARAALTKALAKIANQTIVTTALTPTGAEGIQAGGSVYDDYPDLNNILGVSSQFHIFAREAELNTHTNGNVAVQNLIGNVNFGTNIIEELLDKDISYIQNITNIAGSSFVSAGDTRVNKVVFGQGVEIDVSNPNRPMVNGTYIDHLLSSEVYQDQMGQTYIDFDEEFAKLKQVNESLANRKSEASYTSSDFADQNNRVIDVSDLKPDADNRIVINLSPDVLAGNTPLTIKGLSPEDTGTTIIINVDTGGAEDYTVNSQIRIKYSDGSDRDNQETEHFGDNHLLWNFYDSTASDKQFTGDININAPFQGSILAPSATVIANQNIDGNIIADKVVVKAETHRWDLQDNSEEDKDTDEGDGDGDIDIDEPEPEVPGIEVPDTESPDVETPDVETPSEPGEEANGGDEDLNYEHEHPEYTEDMAEEFEDDLIDFEQEGNTAAEEALLNQVDAAIAKARAEGNTALVAQLESVRQQILAALGLADGLPQTGEAKGNWAQVLGLALATSLLGTAVVRRKRRN